MSDSQRRLATRQPAHWSLRYWNSIAICLLAAATFISGAIGFTVEYFRPENQGQVPRYDLTLPLFKTFQLFLLGSGADDTRNVYLSIARMFAVLLFVMISWAVISRIAQEISLFPKRLFRRGHTVICGFGQIGVQLLDDLADAGLSSKVVIVEPDEDNPSVKHARSLGADVIQGDATRRNVLNEAHADSAQRVFAVTGDDGLNLEIAAEIAAMTRENSQSQQQGRPTVPLKVYTHIQDANLATAFEPHARALHDDTRAEIRVFNVTRNSATQLITQHLWRVAPTSTDEVSHFIIVGFEAMGQTLAVQLAQLAHFSNRKRSRFTIVDRNIASLSRKFIARFNRFTAWNERTIGASEFSPERDLWTAQEPLPAPLKSESPIAIDYVANARFEELPGDAGDERFAFAVAQQLQGAGVKPVVFVCGQHDHHNFDSAIRLRDRLDCLGIAKVPFFVWLPNQPALAQTLTVDSQLYAFGGRQSAAGLNEIESSQRDYFAQRLHNSYEENEVRLNRKAKIEPWSQLSEALRESNRQQADHLVIKLALLGYTIKPRNGADQGAVRKLATASPDIARVLSEMEHNRWVAERLLNGWRYAPQTDRSRKRHRLLVASESLQPDELAIDLNLVEAALQGSQDGPYFIEPLSPQRRPVSPS